MYMYRIKTAAMSNPHQLASITDTYSSLPGNLACPAGIFLGISGSPEFKFKSKSKSESAQQDVADFAELLDPSTERIAGLNLASNRHEHLPL